MTACTFAFRAAVLAWAFACAGAAAQTRPAAPPATLPAETAARVRELVAKLAADDWQTRQEAQERLVRMGAVIRDELRAVLAQTADEESRTRIEAALRQIEDNRLTGTSMITLRLRGASPREAFAQLSRQAGADLRPNPPDLWDSRQWPAADIEIEHQPFWTALRELCSKFGVSPQNSGFSRDMVIAAGASGHPLMGRAPQVVSGPFLVVATYIHANYSVDLNNPQNVNRNCNLQLMVCPEPKLRVLQGSYQAILEEAVDDRGNSLINPAMMAAQMHGLQPGSGNIWNLSAYLAVKGEGARKIARLKGRARFVIQTRAEEAEVADIVNARNVTRTVGGRKFLIKETRYTPNGPCQVFVTVYRPGWSPIEWSQISQTAALRLADADGNSWFRTHAATTRSSNDEIDLTLHFQRINWNGANAVGEPASLIIEVPLETEELTVPFEFVDLPLPT